MHLFRIIRFSRFFRMAAVIRTFALWLVAISNSQPTRCGHTLRGVHCRGWRVAAPLRTLQRQKP